jgi:DNA-3-methyladenine glycosylase II
MERGLTADSPSWTTKTASAPRPTGFTVNCARAAPAPGQDRGMRSFSTVMTDHPAWVSDDDLSLTRAFPLSGGGHAVARTNGSHLDWCCAEAAAGAPDPGVLTLPAQAARAVPELAAALGSLGAVARFGNPSLWDALGTAIIRQVVRAAQAQRQYRDFCAAYGTPVRCGTATGWLFPSPETVLDLGDAQFASTGLAFKRRALRAAASAFLEHGRTWAVLPAADLMTELCRVQRVGPWTAGAAAADWSNDFTAYPCGDLAVRTWAGRAAPSIAWPGDEPGFAEHWRQLAGPHLAELTLLTLAWGGRHARAST